MIFIKLKRIRYLSTQIGSKTTYRDEMNEYICRLEDIKSIETSTFKNSKYRITLNFVVDFAKDIEISHIYVTELPETLIKLIQE